MPWLVLLVEDDDDIRDTLAAILSARGFHVVAAVNGRDAFAQIRERGERPSVIVLDLLMPEMDGETFLDLQADEPLLARVPVVVTTAQLLEPAPVPPHVRAVLHKPITSAELAAQLRAICEEGGGGRMPPAPRSGHGPTAAR